MQQRLEQYLDSLEKPLAKLTTEERREWREEAAQHLSGLITAHEELGSTQDDAVTAAIAQFGDAEQIARQMRQELAMRRIALTPLQAMSGALFLLMLITTVTLLLMGVLSVSYLKGFDLPLPLFRTIVGILFLSTPLISGAVLGSQIARWQIRGRDSRKHTPFFWLAIFLQILLLGMFDSVLGSFAWSFPVGGPEPSPTFSLFSLLLTVLAAGAGRSWKRAQLRRLSRGYTR